jgi:hypothetical protein
MAATALRNRMTAEEMTALDLAYAPSFALGWDKSLVRTGNAPRVMASLPASLAISLPRLDGRTSIAAANRHHARDPQRTLKLLQTA